MTKSEYKDRIYKNNTRIINLKNDIGKYSDEKIEIETNEYDESLSDEALEKICKLQLKEIHKLLLLRNKFIQSIKYKEIFEKRKNGNKEEQRVI